MKKLTKQVMFCAVIALLFWCGTVISDRQQLRREILRLHVVANSDSQEDQQLKLKVRDVVINHLQEDMASIGDVQLAKDYLRERLLVIQETVEKTLQSLGCEDGAAVSLCRESFETRQYETFTLPAGIYDALRITIGEGGGKNWWCVLYPTLCIPASKEETANVAAGAGFSEELTGTLTGREDYEIRFALLDAMGKLENIFFPG